MKDFKTKNGFFTGNVGIGTTDPDANLHVGSGIGTKSIKIKSGGGASGDLIFDSASNEGMIRYEHTTDSMRLHTNGSEKMRIDAAGNVGIGTSNPGSSYGSFTNGGINGILQVAGNTDHGIIGISKASSTDEDYVGTLLFSNEDNSNGSATTRTAIAGIAGLVDTSDANAAHDSGGHLAFLTKPEATGQWTEKMRIDSTGNVGIGTTNPQDKLQVNSILRLHFSDSEYMRMGLISNTASSWGIQVTDSIDGNNNLLLNPASGNVGIGTTSPGSYKLYVAGSAFSTGTWGTSDDRLKHNEQTITGAIETLKKITPKKYIKTNEMYAKDHDFDLDSDGNPIDENGKKVEHFVEAGVIAQEVLSVDELAFAVNEGSVDEDGKETPHGLNYNSLFTYAIAAIQEQQQIIDDLKSQNESLATRISALES